MNDTQSIFNNVDYFGHRDNNVFQIGVIEKLTMSLDNSDTLVALVAYLFFLDQSDNYLLSQTASDSFAFLKFSSSPCSQF